MEPRPTRGAANYRWKPIGRRTLVYLAAESVGRRVSKHQTCSDRIETGPYFVSAPSPARIKSPGRLQLGSVNCLEQLIDVVLLSPNLCTGELLLCLVEVELACSQETPWFKRLSDSVEGGDGRADVHESHIIVARSSFVACGSIETYLDKVCFEHFKQSSVFTRGGLGSLRCVGGIHCRLRDSCQSDPIGLIRVGMGLVGLSSHAQ